MSDQPIEAEEIAKPPLTDEKTPRAAMAAPTVKYRVFDWPTVLTLGPMALAGFAAPVIAAAKRAPVSIVTGSVVVAAAFAFPIVQRLIDRRAHLKYLHELIANTAFVSANGVNVIIGAAAQMESAEMRGRIDQRLQDAQAWITRYAISYGKSAVKIADSFDGALLRFVTAPIPDARGGQDWGKESGRVMTVEADPSLTVDHVLNLVGHEAAHLALTALFGSIDEARDHALMLRNQYPWY